MRKNYRVVVLSIVGDYSQWEPVKGRHQALLKTSKDLAHYYGIEMRFLNYASCRFHANEETVDAVTKVVLDAKPDIARSLWPGDRHPDHEEASSISKSALRILTDVDANHPPDIYHYDTGPSHTVGFEPNTFVDIGDVWPSAIEWIGQVMAFLEQKPYSPDRLDSLQSAKTTMARYRGALCRAKVAEGLWATRPRPIDIL